jgi:hypothetical protein
MPRVVCANIEDTAMNHSVARVESERASIYLQQLCKHFAHKRPVEFTPERGQIALSAGICRLDAAGGVLTIRAEADDADKLAQLQDTIARHLERFAFRSPVTLDWRAAATSDNG